MRARYSKILFLAVATRLNGSKMRVELGICQPVSSIPAVSSELQIPCPLAV
jgi:hypothetical protein